MVPCKPFLRFLIPGCVLLLLPFASAQELQEQVEVKLVQIDVVATDSKGKLVTDLTGDDFTVKENGKVQKVSHFYNSANDETRYPLTMSFLVDTSYSMHEKVEGMTRIDVAVDAADQIMNQVNDKDQIELIDFNEKTNVIVPFTTELESVWNQFDKLKFQEKNTAMYDSVIYALNRIKDKSGRRILVIFSDGMDTSSKSVEEDAIQAIHDSDTTIIAFFSEIAGRNFLAAGDRNSMNDVRAEAGEDILRNFADISGGAFFSFRKEEELQKALENFRAFVKSQYTLAYTPPAGKSGWRKLKVECKRKGVHLNYREGYMAD